MPSTRLLNLNLAELKTIATELQDLVQSKVGVTKFTNVYNQIRQSVLGLRRERKVARVMQVTTNPEAAAKRKMQRNVIKKDSRKRKDRGFLWVLFLTSIRMSNSCMCDPSSREGKGKAKRRREA